MGVNDATAGEFVNNVNAEYRNEEIWTYIWTLILTDVNHSERLWCQRCTTKVIDSCLTPIILMAVVAVVVVLSESITQRYKIQAGSNWI